MKQYKTVEEFMADLPEGRKAEVEALRQIILKAEPRLQERIKWNAPSYILGRDDRITFNLHDKDHVRLILHAGATTKEDKSAKPVLDDDSGLLTWNSNIRATASFDGLEHIRRSEPQLTGIIKEWLRIFG